MTTALQQAGLPPTQINLYACSCGWTSNPEQSKAEQDERALRHKPVKGARQCLVRWWSIPRCIRDTDVPDTPDYPMYRN